MSLFVRIYRLEIARAVTYRVCHMGHAHSYMNDVLRTLLKLYCRVSCILCGTVARQQDGLTQPGDAVWSQSSTQGEGRSVPGGESRASRRTR